MKSLLIVSMIFLVSCARDIKDMKGDGKGNFRVIIYHPDRYPDTTICSGYLQEDNNYYLVREKFIKQIRLGVHSTIIIESMSNDH